MRATAMLLGACTAAAAAQGIPAAWQQASAEFDLFASNATGVGMMPALGNGIYGFEAGQQFCFHSGLFSGGSCDLERNRRDATVRADSNSASTPQIPILTPTVTVPGSSSSSVWQAVDIRHAVFLRTYNITAPGVRATVSQRHYALWTAPDALVFETNVTVEAGSASVVTSCGWGSATDGLLDWTDADSQTRVGTVTKPEDPASPPHRVAVHGACVGGTTTVTASSPLRHLAVVGLASSLRFPASAADLAPVARALASNASGLGPLALYEGHAAAWAARWAAGSIQVEMASEAQQPASAGDVKIPLPAAINSSLYGILSSSRADWPHGVSPGGIATSAYNGNRFWDADSWVFPAMSLLHRDDVGLALTRYRTAPARLASAKLKAKVFGYSGAMYPWQSGETGRELQCGIWGNFEHHITADVSFALLKQWGQMGGAASPEAMAWLRDEAWPVLAETARFWSSRVSDFDLSLAGGLDVLPALLRPGEPTPSGPPARPVTVAHVMGPDEFHYNISTSAYTNAAAAANLMASSAAAAALNASGPEGDAWADLAGRLVVLRNRTSGVHPEFLTWTDTDVAKQADTVLNDALLTWRWQAVSPGGTARDVRYYLNHTTPSGPAMTWGAFLISAIWSGVADPGASLFRRSYSNVQPPFWVWSETPSGGAPHFITGAGGFLQTFTSGYHQLYPASQISGNLTSGELEWRGYGPPPGVKRLSLVGVDVGGCALRLEVSEGRMAASVVGDASPSRRCTKWPTLRPAGGGDSIALPVSMERKAVQIVP